jgi:hypothetical protein
MEIIASILAVLGIGILYFIPSIVAINKKHKQGILTLNLFLGWTLIGWVGALVWAVSDRKEVFCE